MKGLPDWRTHAFRPDLADARLIGLVRAARYIEGRKARVVAPFADIRRTPSLSAPLDAQLWRGDDLLVFEDKDGWSWVRSERDGYVGYVQSDYLAARSADLTHVVCVPRTFIYPSADMKLPIIDALPMGARVSVVGSTETRGTAYAVLDNGTALIAKHVRPVSEHSRDHVAIGETLLHTPYLWGGSTAFGADCSGFVQLCLFMVGISVPRDSDMQAATVGVGFDPGPQFIHARRGDLVFWDGHVGMMCDDETLLHSSGHTMTVTREPLAAAIERIGHLYGQPTVARRLSSP